MIEAKRRKTEDSNTNGRSVPVQINRINSEVNGDLKKTNKGLKCEEILAVREKHIGKSCYIHFPKSPMKIAYGKGQYLYDDEGNQYLDCMNNVTHVGHCNEDVVKACHNQMSTLNTNSRFVYDSIALYTKRLLATLPPHLNVCYFVCSGSEANDLALRMVRTHTKQKDMIVLDRAYHGHTGNLIDISPYKYKALGAEGKKKFVHVVPTPDPYRGLYKGYGPETGQLYANEVKSIIKEAEKNNRKIAGIICESVQGCGGQVVFPENFLKTAFKYVKEAGGVCIADEVQCGFGRTGKTFWAFEEQGAVPDIVTLGKPIGNGHPLAVVVTTQEISESFAATGMSYFNTYGGNPVSCAVGSAVLDVIERDNLQQHANEVGEFFLEKLNKLKQKHKLIGDVRGRGLMIGIELVKDRETLEPATSIGNHIVYRFKDEFVLISTDGLHDNVLKIKPPMCFNKENASYFVEVFDKILTEIESSEHL